VNRPGAEYQDACGNYFLRSCELSPCHNGDRHPSKDDVRANVDGRMDVTCNGQHIELTRSSLIHRRVVTPEVGDRVAFEQRGDNKLQVYDNRHHHAENEEKPFDTSRSKS